jgi:hypothetical protein
LDSDSFSDAEFGKNRANLLRQFAASANRRFKPNKRSQLFIRTHNETNSVAAMHNELNQPRQFTRRSHPAVIRVYDEAGNVIETHEHRGDF